jgi:oxygen-dependent protoporphyrinogen oxidase
MHDVAIVGSGMAGLAAAFELARQRRSFCVLEASDRPGGLIRTERTGGFLIDAGPDAILTTKPAALALCDELGIADRLVPMKTPRTAFVLHGGALHPLPEPGVLGIALTAEAMARTSLFSERGKRRIAEELTISPRSGWEDESIASFFSRRFGDEAVECLAAPLLAGIHMGDANRLSIQALFPRLADAERNRGSVLRAFREAAGAEDEGPFRTLMGGMDDLPAALAAALPAGSVIMNAPVGSVTGRSPFVIDARPRVTIEARAVILAVPAFVAASLLVPHDDEAASICGAIRYASSATVALAYRESDIRRPLNGSGFVVAPSECDVRITAATMVSSKWPGRAPAGQALVRAFFGGSRDTEAVSREAAELVATAHRDLRRVLDIQGEPTLTRIYRWPNASPQYEVGHLDRISRLDEILSRTGNLFVAGSGFHGTGIADCIADGRRAAQRAIGRG